MGSKVRWHRDAWWVRTHFKGKRYDRRIGPSKDDKRQAEEIVRKVNAAIVLGQFGLEEKKRKSLPCDKELRRWHRTHTPTMKLSYEQVTEGLIRKHLAPFFGSKELREIREDDLLAFVRKKLDEGLAPKSIHNALSVLRRVLNLAIRDGKVDRNPAARIGELMRRVDRRVSKEAREVEFWSRSEVEALLEAARAHEPRFAPFLSLLFATGMRRGEALGLRWTDVDFDRRELGVRRAIVRGQVTTPKSGRGRKIRMPISLASELFDLLAERRREALKYGWPEVPEFVFCSKVGTPFDERNVVRTWSRLRRRAQKLGVRPLKLHAARHTWATFALQAGKSVRWVADQLGHSDPALTLRVYAHALREEETDLSFAEFGGSERLYTAPTPECDSDEAPKVAERLARREGFEPPTLRFEA
jgi:integrase